jgi:hypothetical protein
MGTDAETVKAIVDAVKGCRIAVWVARLKNATLPEELAVIGNDRGTGCGRCEDCGQPNGHDERREALMGFYLQGVGISEHDISQQRI